MDLYADKAIAHSQHDSDMTAPRLHDPAFEPHSSFSFEEAADQEEFRNMQRNIESLNVLAVSHTGYQSALSNIHDHELDDVTGMHDHYDADFVNPFVFNEADATSDSPPWATGQAHVGVASQSMQAEIANKRGISVSLHFGQITPPNDVTPKEHTAATRSFRPPPPVDGVQFAKSERARNAANQRHAKSKRARKDSARKSDGPDEEADEVEDKRERYREKNRVAAAKCRAKKKVNTEDLEELARLATAKNSKLRAEERELRDLFSSLRDHALAHDPSQGCGCGAIHSYNMHKARETARGAIGLQRFIAPSPPLRSVDSMSPSTVEPSSRTQSFSEMRPQFPEPGERTQSLSRASPMRYNSSTTDEMMQRQPS